MMKTVMWLGYGGAVLGFAAALAALMGFGGAGTVDGVSVALHQGLMLAIFSTLGLIATVRRASYRRSGWHLLAAALGGVVTAPILFALPGLSLLVAGTYVLLLQRI